MHSDPSHPSGLLETVPDIGVLPSAQPHPKPKTLESNRLNLSAVEAGRHRPPRLLHWSQNRHPKSDSFRELYSTGIRYSRQGSIMVKGGSRVL